MYSLISFKNGYSKDLNGVRRSYEVERILRVRSESRDQFQLRRDVWAHGWGRQNNHSSPTSI